MLSNNRRTARARLRQCFCQRENIMMVATVVSVFLAVILSFPLRGLNLTNKTIFFISMPGLVLMNMLKMLILPLVTCSLLSGLTTLNLNTSGKMGGYTILYYTTTTLFASILGVILVTAIGPGRDVSYSSGKVSSAIANARQMSPEDAVIDLIKNVFASNIIRATIQQERTVYTDIDLISNDTAVNGSDVSISTAYDNNTNFLGLILFTIFFGVVVASMGKKAKRLVELIQVLNDVSMKMITIVLLYVPIGVFFLVLSSLIGIGNFSNVMKSIGLYIVTVISGLLVHSCIILPLVYFALTRKNPFRLMYNMSKAMLTAFIIQSSSATLPVTFKCVEENQKIDSRVTRFMLPIGAIINMDGTGLYEAIAAIFIAQLNGIDLTIGKLVTISLTSTLAAIGAATVPSAGLVTLLMVLTSAGLPTNDVSLLYSFDWFLDRCRTCVNVLGDAYGCGIVEHLCRKNLRQDIRRKSMVPPELLVHDSPQENFVADFGEEEICEDDKL